MSLLDRIRDCNAHDLSDCLPFEVAGQRVGWVKRSFAAHLGAFAEVFAVTEKRISLAPSLADFETRSAALGHVARRLAEEESPRDQRYADWISQYSSEEFSEALDWLRKEMDRLGVGISDEKKNRIREIFLISTRYEWLFWEMCWVGESWAP